MAGGRILWRGILFSNYNTQVRHGELVCMGIVCIVLCMGWGIELNEGVGVKCKLSVRNWE